MYQYPNIRAPRQVSKRQKSSVVSGPWQPATQPTLVTVVESAVRSRLEIAMRDTCRRIHVDSLSEAAQAVRQHGARTLIVSPRNLASQPASELQQLLARCPGMTPVAVVNRDTVPLNDSILRLGVCGVRHLLDLEDGSSLKRLHSLMDAASSEATLAIVDAVLSSLEGAPDETRRFFVVMAQAAPEVATARRLAVLLRVHASTFTSRFHRAGLPTPKVYLAALRLAYAAAYFGVPKISIADVAYRLNYSSPQAFGRHVRSILRVRVSEFRAEYPFTRYMDHVRERLITPYQPILRRFDPIGVCE